MGTHRDVPGPYTGQPTEMTKRVRITDEANEVLDRLEENLRGTKKELASDAILEFGEKYLNGEDREEPKKQ